PDHWYDAGRYLIMSIGGETKFHFPEPEPAVQALDPNAAGNRTAPSVPSIGGFPILQGGDPWAL
ncbi:MAG: hypothetical protein HOQ47_08525, partial [Streptomyces sp.]|nr:hypothetical protein [Streptomyces sp.]